MRIDKPVWQVGTDDGVSVVAVEPRQVPTCPGGKLCAILDYLDAVTGKLSTASVWVTDIYPNPSGEVVTWFNPPVNGKIIGVRFYCVPNRSKVIPPPPSGSEPKETNYLTGPTPTQTAFLAANDTDTVSR